MINDDTHGLLTPQSVRKLLREYRRRERAAVAKEASAGAASAGSK
jgi:hypothetical protein